MATTDTSTTATTRSAADILAQVEEQDIQFIRLWFTDILGQLKSFAVGRDELENALTDGMGFDGSSITGFNRIEESDMIAMPDTSTFEVLPWRPREKAVARMFCDVLVPGGEPYEGDPRYVMRRALARATEMGFDHYYIGPELEFFYFRSSDLNGGGPPEVLDRGGYFDLTTLDAASDLRRETVLALEALGIHVEYTHHEVGPSQHEIDMRFADGLEMADNAMTYRIAVKEIAMKYGVYATFMPKPLFGENGSGMHVHQSLFSGSSNAFFDGPAQLPERRRRRVHRRPGRHVHAQRARPARLDRRRARRRRSATCCCAARRWSSPSTPSATGTTSTSSSRSCPPAAAGRLGAGDAAAADAGAVLPPGRPAQRARRAAADHDPAADAAARDARARQRRGPPHRGPDPLEPLPRLVPAEPGHERVPRPRPHAEVAARRAGYSRRCPSRASSS